MAGYLAKENDVYYIEHLYTEREYCWANKNALKFQTLKRYFPTLKGEALTEKRNNMNNWL